MSETMSKPMSYGDSLHQAAHQFLVEEADALERCDFPAWLAMLAPDVSYQVPITLTVARGVPNHKAGQMHHFNEDMYSLKMRIDRLSTSSAWAEDPASRTQRIVTNVRTFATDDPARFRVASHFLVVRSRGDLHAAETIAGIKEDVLRRTGDGASHGDLKLVHRVVTLAESVLRTQNLAIFL